MGTRTEQNGAVDRETVGDAAPSCLLGPFRFARVLTPLRAGLPPAIWCGEQAEPSPEDGSDRHQADGDSAPLPGAYYVPVPLRRRGPAIGPFHHSRVLTPSRRDFPPAIWCPESEPANAGRGQVLTPDRGAFYYPVPRRDGKASDAAFGYNPLEITGCGDFGTPCIGQTCFISDACPPSTDIPGCGVSQSCTNQTCTGQSCDPFTEACASQSCTNQTCTSQSCDPATESCTSQTCDPTLETCTSESCDPFTEACTSDSCGPGSESPCGSCESSPDTCSSTESCGTSEQCTGNESCGNTEGCVSQSGAPCQTGDTGTPGCPSDGGTGCPSDGPSTCTSDGGSTCPSDGGSGCPNDCP